MKNISVKRQRQVGKAGLLALWAVVTFLALYYGTTNFKPPLNIFGHLFYGMNNGIVWFGIMSLALGCLYGYWQTPGTFGIKRWVLWAAVTFLALYYGMTNFYPPLNIFGHLFFGKNSGILWFGIVALSLGCLYGYWQLPAKFGVKRWVLWAAATLLALCYGLISFSPPLEILGFSFFGKNADILLLGTILLAAGGLYACMRIPDRPGSKGKG